MNAHVLSFYSGLLALTFWVGSTPARAAGQGDGATKGAGPAPLAVDTDGDPLPAGAVARLGRSGGRIGGPIRFLANGMTLLAGGRMENTVYLRDAATGKALRRYELKGQELELFDFSPDGKTVALRDRSNNAPGTQIRELATDKEVTRLPNGGTFAAVFSPDGTLLATSAGNVAVWEVATGKHLYDLPVGPSCWSFAFTADGKTLSTARFGKGTCVVEQWEAQHREETTRPHHQGHPVIRSQLVS